MMVQVVYVICCYLGIKIVQEFFFKWFFVNENLQISYLTIANNSARKLTQLLPQPLSNISIFEKKSVVFIWYKLPFMTYKLQRHVFKIRYFAPLDLWL